MTADPCANVRAGGKHMSERRDNDRRTYDGDHFHVAAIHGDPRFVEGMRAVDPFRADRSITLERLLGGDALGSTTLTRR